MAQGSLGRIVLSTIGGITVICVGVGLTAYFKLSPVYIGFFAGLAGLAGLAAVQVTMLLLWRKHHEKLAKAIRQAAERLTKAN